MKKAKRATRRLNNQRSTRQPRLTTLPFREHLRELRRRLMYIALSTILWSGVAYGVERRIIDLLLKPAHGQSFIYTSPLGGVNFLFQVCIYIGIAMSIPVIVYQFLRYVEPLMKRTSARFVYLGSLASGILALGGMVFGYFIGLPAALNFLLHQFVTNQIHPLLTIEAYLSFVTFYMLGAALMFQIPLMVLFINRITPLKPKQLLHYERWAILFAVILTFIMNPTPNPFDQIFVAGPIILTYQLSILIIWWQNHTPRKRAKLQAMRAQDAEAQALRDRRRAVSTLWQEPVPVTKITVPTPGRVWSRRPIMQPIVRTSSQRLYPQATSRVLQF